MGHSIPSTNLKKYEYINLTPNPVLEVDAIHVHYLFLRDVELSEIDEIVLLIYHGAEALTTSDMAIDLNRSTILAQDIRTNEYYRWFTTIDVSARHGVHELGLIWDITGTNFAKLYDCTVWGKKGLV